MQELGADRDKSRAAAIASLWLFRGETTCPVQLRRDTKAILMPCGAGSELAARAFVELRGRHSSWDRSDLETLATTFEFRRSTSLQEGAVDVGNPDPLTQV